MAGIQEDLYDLNTSVIQPDTNNSDAYDFSQYGNIDLIAMFNCINQRRKDNNSADSSNLNVYGANCMQDFTDFTSQNVLKQTEYRVSVILLHIIVILICTVGNTFVVLTVIKTKAMWTATNIFIANLAVSDIFVGAFVLPFSAYYELTGDWIFGWAMCHVFMMAFGVVVYISTLTLTLIAIDRYMLIIHPMAKRMSVTIALILILVIIVLASFASLPIAIYSTLEEHVDTLLNIRQRGCMEKWPSDLPRKIYTVLTLIVQFFLPLLIIAILYLRIFRRIRQRISTQSKNSRRTKTTKMLVAVVGVFAVAWTPYHINSILIDFKIHPYPVEYINFINLILRVFAMSSSCTNPILYGWLNDNFRNAFLSIIKRPTATPTGIHNDETEVSRRLVIAQSPMRKFYKKITNKGGQTQNGKENSSCCSSPNKIITQEAVPLQTIVVDRNGHRVVLPKDKVDNLGDDGDMIGGKTNTN